MASVTRHRVFAAHRLPWASILLASLGFVAAGLAGRASAGGETKDITTIAVLDFRAEKIPAETALAVSDSLTAHLSASHRFRLWNRAVVSRTTRNIMDEQYGGPVCEEIGCAVRIGAELGCNTVIVGSVSKFGRLVTVSADAVEVSSQSIAGTWIAESFTGEAGLPEAVRHLAEQVAASAASLPRGEVRPPEPARKEDLLFEDFEMSFALGAGFGLHGLESSKRKCRTDGEATVCLGNTASFTWLAEIGLLTRLKKSKWSLGLRAGAASAKTTWEISVEADAYSDFASGEDSGFNYYLYPVLGYVLYEARTARIMLAAGVGYRDFSEESEVGKAFSSAGLSVRVFPVRVDLTYWHGFASESLLRDMVTSYVGFGTGF
jgi:TolB-like protein